jgi:nuclear pore complex protein Nup121
MKKRMKTLHGSYTNIGEFPIVHLEKEQMKIIPKSTPSVPKPVRILPPQRSLFLSQSRSQILKKNQQPEPQIMRPSNVLQNENAPISPMHEVIEPLPTKSALDELKEVSRKRINNEELDAERVKKKCQDGESNDPNCFFKQLGAATCSLKRPRAPSVTRSGIAISTSKRVRHNDVINSLTSAKSLQIPKPVDEDFENEIENDEVDNEVVTHEESPIIGSTLPVEPEAETLRQTASNESESDNNAPKVRMFNKDIRSDDADDEEYRISDNEDFVHPKNMQDKDNLNADDGKGTKLQRILGSLMTALAYDPRRNKRNDVVDGKTQKNKPTELIDNPKESKEAEKIIAPIKESNVEKVKPPEPVIPVTDKSAEPQKTDDKAADPVSSTPLVVSAPSKGNAKRYLGLSMKWDMIKWTFWLHFP